jgi:type II secretory pathway pseudopilin PulG
MKNRQKKIEAGFSLIESLLYIALLVIILGILSFMFRESIYYKGRMAEKFEVNDNGQFAINKIIYYLRQADTISEPQGAAFADYLLINIAENQINIYNDGGILKIKINNDEAQNLTNDHVKVSDLNFSSISIDDKNSLIKISFNLQSANSGFWHDNTAFFQTSILKTE